MMGRPILLLTLCVICIPSCPTFQHSKTYLTYPAPSRYFKLRLGAQHRWWMSAWCLGTCELYQLWCQLWGCYVPTRRRIDRRSGSSQPKKVFCLLLVQKRPWYNEGKVPSTSGQRRRSSWVYNCWGPLSDRWLLDPRKFYHVHVKFCALFYSQIVQEPPANRSAACTCHGFLCDVAFCVLRFAFCVFVFCVLCQALGRGWKHRNATTA